MIVEMFLALWLLGALTIFVFQVVSKGGVGQRHEALLYLLMAFCWPFLAAIFVLGFLQWLVASLLHLCRKSKRR